ncbi:MAG: acetolactate synthase small subunit [Desulfofustis sp.]|nr:acetolactate synthase small subunit [Desulfofustis sp.]MBT8352914.1 acetolactate synthase small subunit [Desulfofustis sp.]NNF47840.1 acetolactate synthase small subunit [Desulfofustis sp.]NNK56553.1 acetolactate synthase small subunit [Desulfofustis sp.]
MKRRAILAFMLDRPGVLNKVSMLIRKKMYNVDTLTVCSSRVPGISRMTITLREDDIAKVTQVIKQLEKFTEVISAKELDTNKSYWREAAIVKLEIDSDHLKSLQDRFNFEMLEKKNRDIQIIQVAGSTAQIDTFLDEIGRENIIEIARTGVAAMEK